MSKSDIFAAISLAGIFVFGLATGDVASLIFAPFAGYQYGGCNE